MLQRSIRVSLRQATRCPSRSGRKSCVVCTCQCGAQLQRNGNARQYSKAPSTRRKEWQTQSKYLSPEDVRWGKAYAEAVNAQFTQMLALQHRMGNLSVDANTAKSFLYEFDISLDKSHRRSTIDPKHFDDLAQSHGMLESDVILLARLLLREDDANSKSRGKKLFLSLSRAGSVDATIFVMGQAQLQAKRKPAVLKSVEIAHSREHLRQIAHEGWSYRAMVLEGRIALMLGEEGRAISLWTAAVETAVAAAEKETRLRRRGKQIAQDTLELSSPWIELMLIHYQRSRNNPAEMEKCRWAMEIGCNQDDPTSHFYAASFTKRVDEAGNHIPTSDWLYHMTKAASSGHQRACHDLAVFYAQSGWKYIEDEPPEYIKPTAFDSYPSPPFYKAFWTRMKEILGLATPPKHAQKDHLFLTATFPNTAADRFKLAFLWLEVPIYYQYAPSFLFKAKMYMQETLWAGAEAPKPALELTKDRYSYASREDYIAGRRIEQEENPTKGEEKEVQDPPNPFYNLDEARKALREVFNAYEANVQVENIRIKHAGRRLRGSAGDTGDDDAISRHGEMLAPRLRKWLVYPVVREMYEDELKDLYDEAKGICDDRGWDMYDQEGGLLYKAKVKREMLEVAAQ